MEIPFLAWLLQGIPECVGCAAIIFSISFKELAWKKIIITGLIQAVFIYIIRLLPLTPYSHTFLVIPVIAFTVSFLTGMDIRLTHIYSVLAMLFLLVAEGGIFSLLNSFKIITFEKFINDTTTRIIYGTPQNILLFAMAWLIHYMKNNVYIMKLLMNIGISTWRR